MREVHRRGLAKRRRCARPFHKGTVEVGPQQRLPATFCTSFPGFLKAALPPAATPDFTFFNAFATAIKWKNKPDAVMAGATDHTPTSKLSPHGHVCVDFPSSKPPPKMKTPVSKMNTPVSGTLSSLCACRAPTIAAAYLIARRGMSVREAIQAILCKRPRTWGAPSPPRRSFVNQVCHFASRTPAPESIITG
jgi:hypothetical protein